MVTDAARLYILIQVCEFLTLIKSHRFARKQTLLRQLSHKYFFKFLAELIGIRCAVVICSSDKLHFHLVSSDHYSRKGT